MIARNIRELIRIIAENHLIEKRTKTIQKGNKFAKCVRQSNKIFNDLLDNNYISKCSVGEGN